MSDKLVEVRALSKHFQLPGGQTLKAVDEVSFDIRHGETLGLVGESGCGKTTLGRTIKRIYEPTSGRIFFEGQDISGIRDEALRAYAKRAQMIFQDPYSSLNPRMTVAEIVAEGMVIHKLFPPKGIRKRTHELLEMVGLSQEHAGRFPHEFSGGQRQRIGIARALAVNPSFIVCDEPISALDVSIQAQVVNLFKQLQRQLNLTYLFVAHDLAMVKYISNRVAVMYLGRIVEIALSSELYKNPAHPYTEFLLSAIPIPDPAVERNRVHVELADELPSPIDLPAGCSFQGRCKYKTEECARTTPSLQEIAPGHVACCTRAMKGSNSEGEQQ
ncbi:MAG: ATP-binding cassette domain-containing protein [Oscillospiraceae bacterium]|nr:ATP-binding cassette domain-containing protein [Oscillospiraceae bacterium]